ncbi:hypothetical protein AAKU61_000170 [Undibacterium sp. GrIS 1.2]|uniref:hypothetical protein n=1 Tax=Undibacterium sp. GrIS 1.2 TaxID=3143933 RepID=UPI003399869F
MSDHIAKKGKLALVSLGKLPRQKNSAQFGAICAHIVKARGDVSQHDLRAAQISSSLEIVLFCVKAVGIYNTSATNCNTQCNHPW